MRRHSKLQPQGWAGRSATGGYRGRNTFFFYPSPLFLLLCPLDPKASLVGNDFQHFHFSGKGRRRAVYDTGISCADPSRKISLYIPTPVWVLICSMATHTAWLRRGTKLGQSISYCSSSPHLLSNLAVDHVLTALFKPLNQQSLYFLFFYLCAAVTVCNSGHSFRSQF